MVTQMVLNGVNVEQLVATVNAIRRNLRPSVVASALVACLLGLSQPAKAQVGLAQVVACKGIILVEQPLFGGSVIARHLETSDCGDRFTTADRYVGLFVHADVVM